MRTCSEPQPTEEITDFYLICLVGEGPHYFSSSLFFLISQLHPQQYSSHLSCLSFHLSFTIFYLSSLFCTVYIFFLSFFCLCSCPETVIYYIFLFVCIWFLSLSVLLFLQHVWYIMFVLLYSNCLNLKLCLIVCLWPFSLSFSFFVPLTFLPFSICSLCLFLLSLKVLKYY